MRRQILAVIALGVVAAVGIGKGPVEKAGTNVDDAVKDVTK